MEVVRMQRKAEEGLKRVEMEEREGREVEMQWRGMEEERGRLQGYLQECERDIQRMHKARQDLLAKKSTPISLPANYPKI